MRHTRAQSPRAEQARRTTPAADGAQPAARR